MKINKKIFTIFVGCVLITSGLFFSTEIARAGGASSIVAALVGPLIPIIIDPITVTALIIDYNSCDINVVWGCNSGGGSTPPSGGNSVVGVCGSGINNCSSGTLGENHAQSGGIYDWYCMGINGGANSGLCQYIPNKGPSGPIGSGPGSGYCGDNSCNNGETCSSCPGDCGNCGGSGGYCGDNSCNNGETCSSCPGDCGSCGGGPEPYTPPPPPYCPPSTSYGGWSDCNAACHGHGSQSRSVSGNNSDCSTFSYTDTQSCYVSCPPVCSFSANPSTIVLPQTSTLSWSCQYAEYGCSINNEIGSVSPISGSVEVSPPKTTIYTLGCNGIDGSGTWNATVTNGFDPTIKEVIPR